MKTDNIKKTLIALVAMGAVTGLCRTASADCTLATGYINSNTTARIKLPKAGKTAYIPEGAKAVFTWSCDDNTAEQVTETSGKLSRGDVVPSVRSNRGTLITSETIEYVGPPPGKTGTETTYTFKLPTGRSVDHVAKVVPRDVTTVDLERYYTKSESDERFAPAKGSTEYAPSTGSTSYAPATGSTSYAPAADHPHTEENTQTLTELGKVAFKVGYTAMMETNGARVAPYGIDGMGYYRTGNNPDGSGLIVGTGVSFIKGDRRNESSAGVPKVATLTPQTTTTAKIVIGGQGTSKSGQTKARITVGPAVQVQATEQTIPGQAANLVGDTIISQTVPRFAGVVDLGVHWTFGDSPKGGGMGFNIEAVVPAGKLAGTNGGKAEYTLQVMPSLFVAYDL